MIEAVTHLIAWRSQSLTSGLSQDGTSVEWTHCSTRTLQLSLWLAEIQIWARARLKAQCCLQSLQYNTYPTLSKWVSQQRSERLLTKGQQSATYSRGQSIGTLRLVRLSRREDLSTTRHCPSMDAKNCHRLKRQITSPVNNWGRAYSQSEIMLRN